MFKPTKMITYKFIASKFDGVMREGTSKTKPGEGESDTIRYEFKDVEAVFNDLGTFNDAFRNYGMLAGDDRPNSQEILVINPTMKE